MKRSLIICGSLLLLLAQSTAAQQGTMEFGIDSNIGYILTDDVNGFEADDVFAIAIPTTAFRFGYFVSNQVSIEPALAVDFFTSDGDSFLDLSLSAGVLYHFSADPAKTRPFVRFSPTIRLIDRGDNSASQFGLVGQAGIKAPLKGPLAAKIAVGVKRDFENDDFFGATTIFGTFGLSFFVDR
ncbi:MAG: hypothetical protein R3178_08820 [Rhodothermales bacterium]|nr:hypothetical protein [Rhodothermales bacterium]